MTAEIMDGRAASKAEMERLKQAVAALGEQGVTPALTAVQAGEDPASAWYVGNQRRHAERLGIEYRLDTLPGDADRDAVLARVDHWNGEDAVHGLIVQLPLPDGVDSGEVQRRIAPAKDVEGVHPANLGRLVSGPHLPAPCTPQGGMRLLDEAGVELEGAEAVVVGRSAIVGKPMALMLLHRNATVTVCHSRTRDLAEVVGRADVVVAAVGRPDTITRDMVKPGAVVVDFGINQVPVPEDERKEDGPTERMVGDVAADVAEVAGRITPVPGGTGPMTTVMLMRNAIAAAAEQNGLDPAAVLG